MLAFGARVVGIELAKMIVDAWLSGEYEGGRHQVRIDMLKEIEEKLNMSTNKLLSDRAKNK